MTTIICDSSLLILVTKLELLDILIESFDTIFIPSAVYSECVIKGKELKKLDAFSIEKKVKDSKIIVKEIKNIKERKNLIKNFNIHKGESETIILYSEEKADLLGTDDYRTLKVCNILDIKYFTTPIFLVRSYEREKLSKEICILKLEKLDKLGWYKEDFLEEFKNKIENKEV